MIKNLLKAGIAMLIITSQFSFAAPIKELPQSQYYGYKVTHHMTEMIKHLDQFGFNTFDHPAIADHRFFVITPALDHLYSKAIIDTRWGPVIVDTPAKDDRYSSISITDMEHFVIYEKVTAKAGERFVIVHEDYQGELPEGTVIKTKSDFPLVFLRTQSFAFNEDKLSNSIRQQAKIYGAWQPVDLPNEKDPQAIINWTIEHTTPYKETAKLMKAAAKSHTTSAHKEAFNYIYKYLQTGQVTSSTGMFDAIDSPTGATHIVRAAGTLLGHLGLPTQHAFYQNIPVDRSGKLLSGENGSFKMSIPHNPGMKEFWSITRYSNKTRLPLNPADIGGNDIQAYNGFNTTPDKNGNVTFTFSQQDPKDGSYWMPVTKGYYLIIRYYGPNEKMNGNTAHDIVYKGTKLETMFKSTKF